MSQTTDALSAAVNAENAAVFTYGAITPFVASTRRRTIVDQISSHRAHRDALVAAITAAGGVAPAAAAGYTLPVEVTNPTTAAQAALAAEVDCTVAYRSVIERAESDAARRTGVDGLTESTLRVAYWRAALGEKPTTVAFPGTP